MKICGGNPQVVRRRAEEISGLLGGGDLRELHGGLHPALKNRFPMMMLARGKGMPTATGVCSCTCSSTLPTGAAAMPDCGRRQRELPGLSLSCSTKLFVSSTTCVEAMTSERRLSISLISGVSAYPDTSKANTTCLTLMS